MYFSLYTLPTFFGVSVQKITMNQMYFAIEGTVGAGKSTMMGWMGDMLKRDGYKFDLVPEPIEKFKRWKTYDLFVEGYQHDTTSGVMA